MRDQTLYTAFHSFFYVNGTYEHDTGSSWGALWARLSGKASEDPLKWCYFKFVWQVQLCEFISLHFAFTTDGINFYFSIQSLPSYPDSFDSSSVHLALDPAGKLVDISIDSRFVLLSAAVPPAHHTADVVASIWLTHQWSAWVTLQRHRRSDASQRPRLGAFNRHTWQESMPPCRVPAQNMLLSRTLP